MSRVAARLGCLALAVFAAAAPASAADVIVRRGDGGPAATDGPVACRAPEIVSARFEEQVCTRGAAGYAECHWVKRVHEVDVPGHCSQKYTSEAAYPATRGSFPPYPHVAPRR